jgi:hypothetical protein
LPAGTTQTVLNRPPNESAFCPQEVRSYVKDNKSNRWRKVSSQRFCQILGVGFFITMVKSSRCRVFAARRQKQIRKQLCLLLSWGNSPSQQLGSFKSASLGHASKYLVNSENKCVCV